MFRGPARRHNADGTARHQGGGASPDTRAAKPMAAREKGTRLFFMLYTHDHITKKYNEKELRPLIVCTRLGSAGTDQS
jgi:hypothetical protein